MKKALVFLACMALLLAFPGCTTTKDSSVSSSDTAASSTGIPSSADPFAALWAKIDGSTATIPLSEAIAKHFLGITDDQAAQLITHNTTDVAYYNLMNKQADLIFVTYPSEAELASAQQNGVTLDIIPVVKDALVFLVNAQNPVNSLTQQQLINIYTGNVTNWSAVGGANAAIQPFQRPANSGSQTLFLKLLMKDTAPMIPPAALVQAEMGGLIDAVANYSNASSALGYSVFYYANDMYAQPAVKLLGVDGVMPTKATIEDGSYPLPTYYYAVLRQDTPADHPARQLLAWLLAQEGQQVADAAGYVPIGE